MPEVISPGRIPIQFRRNGFDGEAVLYDFIFTWGGGNEADWFWDISPDNPGMSVMSSAPFGGTATWTPGSRYVEITYASSEFDFEGEETLLNAAPNHAALDKPQTWVDLADEIANYCYSLIE